MLYIYIPVNKFLDINTLMERLHNESAMSFLLHLAPPPCIYLILIDGQGILLMLMYNN